MPQRMMANDKIAVVRTNAGASRACTVDLPWPLRTVVAECNRSGERTNRQNSREAIPTGSLDRHPHEEAPSTQRQCSSSPCQREVTGP